MLTAIPCARSHLDHTKAGGTKNKFKAMAYTLDVIQDMLEKLHDPPRTVCATASHYADFGSKVGELAQLSTRAWYAFLLLGTDAKTVQTILQHANMSTTVAHFIIPDPVESAGHYGEIWDGFGLQMDPSEALKRGKKSRKSHKVLTFLPRGS